MVGLAGGSSPPTARPGSITIYRNKKLGAYIVQPMARHPFGGGAHVEFGEPTRLTEAEFDSRIVETVLENLARYDREPFRQELATRRTKEDDTKFRRVHDGVSVARKESGVVEITPWEHVRGGYAGINDSVVALREDEVSTRLAAALREAFTRCR